MMSNSRPGNSTTRPSPLRHGIYLVLEKLLRWSIHPKLRSKILKLLGAKIGKNVRIYEIQLFNLELGFRNLHLSDDVHIGPGCRIDLSGILKIGMRSTISPGVTILTHADPGSSHHSKILKYYPPHRYGVSIGIDCWVGANTTILDAVTIGDNVVVAAGSVVTNNVEPKTLVAGAPARVKKFLA